MVVEGTGHMGGHVFSWVPRESVTMREREWVCEYMVMWLPLSTSGGRQ
jgi:hypothetical protein